MSVWEGGFGEQPEEEREVDWQAPDPLETPDPDAWKEGEEWPEEMAGPEYWLYKKQEGDDHGPST